MTLGEIADRYRGELMDESVGVRRSWEEMFTHTFRHYPRGTPLNVVDLSTLSQRLSSAGMQECIVAGYVERWRCLLSQTSAGGKGSS
jgi:hypothetical protein